MPQPPRPKVSQPGTAIGDPTQGGTPAGEANDVAPSTADPRRRTGQQSSEERGVATRSKNNPGQRPHQGGRSP